MARIRTIKPEFPQSESMGQCTRDARLTFLLLFTMADDSGRLRANSRMLASLLYPYDDDAKKHIESWLVELENVGCIQRYQVDGDSYLSINKWAMHQKIDKPTPSKIPSPPESSRILANPRESSSRVAELPSADRIGKEGNGEDRKVSRQAARFEDFWKTWPKSERKQDKAKCMEKWKSQNLDQIADLILGDIETKKRTQKWQGGYIEAPEVYLNNKRWEDGVTPDEHGKSGVADPESRAAIEADGISMGIGPWNEGMEQWHIYKAKVRGSSPSGLSIGQLAEMARRRAA